jgi:hypothetical protein
MLAALGSAGGEIGERDEGRKLRERLARLIMIPIHQKSARANGIEAARCCDPARRWVRC